MKKFLISCILFLFSLACLAQHDEKEEYDEFHPHHTLGVVISHTILSEGVVDGKKKWLALPSWGLNYNYKFSKKWAIGLHNDFITENFVVEEHSSESIERTHPFASTIVTSFKPGTHFNYMLGFGGEFSEGKNFFLIRLGIEYEHHISKNWELNFEVSNDFKVNAYNSWAIGLGVARVFSKKSKTAAEH